ncbi:MAG: hypothetical protein ACO4BJ_09625 [Planctomycetota bacterium]
MEPSTITRNEDLGEGWFLLEVHAPSLAPRVRAGQFVQVKVSEGDDPLIRRPFSVSDVLPEPGDGAERIQILYQVVGPGTRRMQRFRPEEPVDLLGPLGNPLPHPEVPSNGLLLLVGGGIGVAPLHMLCRELAARADAPPHKVLLGARRRSLLVGWEAFERLGVDTEVSRPRYGPGRRGGRDRLRSAWNERRAAGPLPRAGDSLLDLPRELHALRLRGVLRLRDPHPGRLPVP